MPSESSASKPAPERTTVSPVTSRLRTPTRLGIAVLLALSLMMVTACSRCHGRRQDEEAPGEHPGRWAERFCTEYQDFQAAALDARDASFPVVRAPTTDRTQVRASAKALQAALKPPTVAARDMTSDLERPAPKGRGGTPLGAAAADSVARVSQAYNAASASAQELLKATPTQFAKRAPIVLTRLDADLDRAAKPLARVERLVRKSAVLDAMNALPVCSRIGLDWSPLDDFASAGSTPVPVAVDARHARRQ